MVARGLARERGLSGLRALWLQCVDRPQLDGTCTMRTMTYLVESINRSIDDGGALTVGRGGAEESAASREVDGMDRLLVAAKESTHAPRRNLPYEHSHVVARGGNVFPAAQHGQNLGEPRAIADRENGTYQGEHFTVRIGQRCPDIMLQAQPA